MNKEQVNKYKKEIMAFCEGKIIEFRFHINMKNEWSPWSINDNPDFIASEDYQYRIKSEPKELWCIYNSDGILLYAHKTQEDVEGFLTNSYNKDSGYHIVHFIEDTAV